jgi:hypothetical protein
MHKFGPTSDLKQYLLAEEMITSSISIGNLIDPNNVILSLAAETKYPEELKKILLKEIKEFEMTEKDIERRKKVEISNMVMRSDDIQEMNLEMQIQIFKFHHLIDKEYEIYQKLNLEKLMAVKNKLNFKNYSCLIIRPFDK